MTRGLVIKQKKIWVDIDWENAPKGTRKIGSITIDGQGFTPVTIQLTLCNPKTPALQNLKGFVENNGYISMEAEHYTKKTSVDTISWEKIADYGRTGSSMGIFPVTAASILPPAPAPCLEYEMYIFNPGELEVTTFTAPSLNINPEHGLRYAIAFDEQSPVIVDTFRTDQDGFYTDNEWSNAVMQNVCSKTTPHTVRKKGYHTLKIWMIDPGVVLQKIFVNTGGVKKSYLGPPESYYKGKKQISEFWKPSIDPVTIPGKIEAEHYRDGINRQVYYDSTEGNTYSLYREDDVDIASHENSFIISDIEPGEWLTYDVFAHLGTDYNITIKAANGSSSPGILRLFCDTTGATRTIEIPPTGDTNTFVTVPVSGYSLSVGKHLFTLYADTPGMSIDWMEFSTPTGNIWIEAELAAEQPGFKPFTVTKKDPLASGSAYIMMKSGTRTTRPEDTGIAEYPFEARGNVNIWMRVHTPSPEDDSFFIKVDEGPWREWNNIEGSATQFAWVLWKEVKNLNDAIHTISVAYREDGAKLDKILITPDLDFVPGEKYREAESAANQQDFAPIQKVSDPDASGAAYIIMKSGVMPVTGAKGIAEFSFNAHGNVNVWMNIQVPENNNNSLFIQLDTGRWQEWNNIQPEKKWTWILWKKLDNLSEIQHTLRVAGGNDGIKLDTILFSDNLGYVPGNYANKPVPIPGLIQAEDYNIGPNGIAYNDTTPGNECGMYRNDDVDICAHGDGFAIGYTINREWLKYEVEVEQAARYTIEVNGSNGTKNSQSVHFEIDGKDITKPGKIRIPSTGDWETYVSTEYPGVVIPEGKHTLTLFIDTAYTSIDYIKFTRENEKE